MICDVLNAYLPIAVTDPNFSSTVLLLGMDGTNGSTTFTDESAAAHGNASVTGATNDTHVDTSFPKFGSGSARFDGGNDLLAYANHADWKLGSGDYTIEMWFSSDAAQIESNQTLISLYATTGNQRSWQLIYRGGDATNLLRMEGSSNGSTASVVVAGSAWTPTADTFYHIAIDCASGTTRIYIDGVMMGKTTTAFTYFNSTTVLRVGGSESGGGLANPVKGNIDELRITKGVARYASDSGYTVPTAAFPRS